MLAPGFRAAVEKSLAQCIAAGYDAYVYESYRSPELQALYYKRGRTILPPPSPVTNAPDNLSSWHGYGLAVDVISRRYGWDRPPSWFAAVAAIFKQNGCSWGGDWKKPDPPHMQWGRCKPSPSPLARELMKTNGMKAVWEAVGAG